jgi:lipid-A-disaccharide synthase
LKQTFLTLHESIRRDADEQAAQAVMELARK